MEFSSVEKLRALLENWSKAETRVHFSLANNWEGWKFDGFVSFDEVELKGGILTLGFFGCAVSFEVGQFGQISFVNPLETPEVVSSPESERQERVSYVSDEAVLINILERGSKSGHSFLALSKIMDEASFGKA
jgi:hypothetical protein